MALIDTGSAFSFIRKDVLNQIEHKKYISDSDYINIYGKKYITSNFLIPEVKIGGFVAETIFKEEAENFLAECVVDNNFLISWKVHLMYQVYREAIIGMDLFQKFACIFDFPHSSIYIAKEITHIIENEDFFTADWHSVEFELGKSGVVLMFETDLGKKRLLLDSGSTLSIIRFTDKEKVAYQDNVVTREFTSKKLMINGLDFGSCNFRVMDIAGEMNDIDGLVGIEFFNKNIICLDFPNKIAHIQTPRLGSKERFNYWLKSCFGK